MNLRLKIIIAVLSIICATLVVLGDGALHTLGFPRGFGRVTFLILLTAVIAAILGVTWWRERRAERRAAAEHVSGRDIER